jgi:hypothetical protein
MDTAKNHYQYEVHLVSYTPTPELQGTTRLIQSDVELDTIATAIETDDPALARAHFNDACKQALQFQKFKGHVKLERLCASAQFFESNITSPDVAAPLFQNSVRYQDNMFVGGFGWDVHIDGTLHSEIVHALRKVGWVFLEYQDKGEVPCGVLTLHFLSEEDCRAAYETTLQYLEKSGGFSGNVYWEEPLGYLVRSW